MSSINPLPLLAIALSILIQKAAIAAWKKLIQSSGGKIVKTLPGEIFQLFKVQF